MASHQTLHSPAMVHASASAVPVVLRLGFVLAATLAGLPAFAQQAPGPAPATQPENVRIEYAQVLRAEPVYQTLHATSMVERCDATTPVQDSESQKTGLARVLGAVRGALTPDPKVEEVAPSAGGKCRLVPLEREFRRPVAYDVDYVHRGVKYRSRLPQDPGNRVQVRVSVTPVVTAEIP